MKSMIIRQWIMAVALCLWVLSAMAGEAVDETRSVEANGRILIDIPRGTVKVFAWEKSAVQVQGQLDDRTEAFTFEVDDHMTVIKVRIPESTYFGEGSRLDIFVPTENKVSFRGVSSDIEINKTRGGVTTRTVSGNVLLKKVDSRIEVNTVSGHVRVDSGQGRLKVVTVSGDMEIDYHAEEVDLQTVSGDIEAALVSVSRLRIQTVSGDVGATAGTVDSATLDLETVSGDVMLGLADSVDARITVTTGPGGDIYNRLTKEVPEEIFPGQVKLVGQAGEGKGRIRINTVTGDVHLKKE